MTTSPIHPDTTLGYVHLTISDLNRSLEFYRRALGFRVHRREGETAFLGAGGDDLLALTEWPGARRPRHATGLYHFAVLVPSRLELAQSLKRIAETETPVQGFADHFVSEAIYLADPDGNGIEICRDRPRSDWRDAQGNIRMGTDPLDVEGVMSELRGSDAALRQAQGAAWNGLDPATVLGHMHLQVSNLREAETFYCDVVGFGLIAHYGGSAAFVSAGGYHHHLGLNTWGTVGAPPQPPEAVGLRYFVVRVPDQNELSKVIDKAQAAGVAVDERNNSVLLRDPSQNAVVIEIKK